MASFQFEVKELGEKISDAEMEEFKKSRYGDLRVRQVIILHLLSKENCMYVQQLKLGSSFFYLALHL